MSSPHAAKLRDPCLKLEDVLELGIEAWVTYCWAQVFLVRRSEVSILHVGTVLIHVGASGEAPACISLIALIRLPCCTPDAFWGTVVC